MFDNLDNFDAMTSRGGYSNFPDWVTRFLASLKNSNNNNNDKISWRYEMMKQEDTCRGVRAQCLPKDKCCTVLPPNRIINLAIYILPLESLCTSRFPSPPTGHFLKLREKQALVYSASSISNN